MTRKKKEEINSEEQQIKKIRKEVEKLFDKYNISAVIKIPGVEVLSAFQEHSHKLEILEYIYVENKIREKLLEKEIETSVNEEFNMKSTKSSTSTSTPSYTR